MKISELQEISIEDPATEDDLTSHKPLDELIEEQDFDPEDPEAYYDEDESVFPSLWDSR